MGHLTRKYKHGFLFFNKRWSKLSFAGIELQVFTQNLLNITHCMEKIERVLKSAGNNEKEVENDR